VNEEALAQWGLSRKKKETKKNEIVGNNLHSTVG
jgi:hypothetical protein